MVLPVIKHKKFIRMISIENQEELLAFIKREDNLRDAFQRHGTDHNEAFRSGP